jgi:hypothetical protein
MNSFIGQLNMYGFNKARHDSSKCVKKRSSQEPTAAKELIEADPSESKY